MKNSFSLFLLIFILLACDQNEDVIVESPEFITSDIELFWQVYDESTTQYSANEFKEFYIDRGTVGLRDFDAQKNITPQIQNLLRNPHYKAYFEEIRANTLDLETEIEICREAFEDLGEIYPDTRYFKTYFLIGGMSAGGKVSKNGLLIGTDLFTKNEATSTDNLNSWHRLVVKTKSFLPSIVVHEFIHKNQQFRKQESHVTILEISILEGMADFVAHKLLPNDPFFNEHVHEYGKLHEEQLWTEFKGDMDKSTSNNHWTGNGGSHNIYGHPPDMGYFLGYQIMEAYASQFSTMDEAISSMLSNNDYYDIFEKSKYASKFD